MSKCRYCEFWKNSSKREPGNPTTRFCEKIKKMVNKEDSICDYKNFVMGDFFWCDDKKHYKSCVLCIKNQENDLEPECQFCTQGEDVSLAYECLIVKLKRRKQKLIRRA